MKTYGTIKFSTVDAPSSVKAYGICENYNYKLGNQQTEIQGEEGIAGIVLHGEKGEISFSVTPPGSATALVVRAGAELSITGISTGKTIVTSAGAKWQRGQPMTMDIAATHYASISATAAGTLDITGLGAFSQTEAALVLPTGKVWFGTTGLTGAVTGIVQACSITETVQIQEEEDDAGAIVALAVHSYKATASMEILTAVALSEIALGDTLDVFGNFSITSAEEKFSKGGTHTISVEGILIPGVTE